MRYFRHIKSIISFLFKGYQSISNSKFKIIKHINLYFKSTSIEKNSIFIFFLSQLLCLKKRSLPILIVGFMLFCLMITETKLEKNPYPCNKTPGFNLQFVRKFQPSHISLLHLQGDTNCYPFQSILHYPYDNK